jgi:hypothetical protein
MDRNREGGCRGAAATRTAVALCQPTKTAASARRALRALLSVLQRQALHSYDRILHLYRAHPQDSRRYRGQSAIKTLLIQSGTSLRRIS